MDRCAIHTDQELYVKAIGTGWGGETKLGCRKCEEEQSAKSAKPVAVISSGTGCSACFNR